MTEVVFSIPVIMPCWQSRHVPEQAKLIALVLRNMEGRDFIAANVTPFL
jgi:hypothetical protein